jgi:2-polyprenyl-3-methyl-5-hydroxy-6-metoxy-1,4-benzoquinol methylase
VANVDHTFGYNNHRRMKSSVFDPKARWESIYAKKGPQEMSWFQATPTVSLGPFSEYGVKPNARIIDVGGGDGLLVDHLLERGFTDLTVLDISGKSLAKAQERVGA